MSQYGAFYGRWAPITAETNAALPTYGEAVTLGAITKVTDAPTFHEATAEGDDRVQDSLAEFSNGTVDLNFAAGIDNAAKAAIWGSDLTEDGELIQGADDEPPYGGYAIATRMLRGSKKYFQGVFYPKLQAVPQGKDYNTRQRSGATLTGDDVHMKWETPLFGKYKYTSPEIETEEEIKAWVDGKLSGAGAEENPEGQESEPGA